MAEGRERSGRSSHDLVRVYCAQEVTPCRCTIGREFPRACSTISTKPGRSRSSWRLNAGILPRGLSALVEQRSGPRESDVLTIESLARPRSEFGNDGGVATLEPPVTRFVGRTSKQIYATRANRIVVKHRLGRTVAVIEIVSPGNKDSRAALARLR